MNVRPPSLADCATACRAFRPRILVFACRWCALPGADEAGRQRLVLPPDFRLIPVECAARVDVDTVLKAFSMGIDGVALLACHLDGCRYERANHATRKRMALLAALLDTVGVGSQRLFTGFGTAHEGSAFARRIDRFWRSLRDLGPVGGPVGREHEAWPDDGGPR